MSYRASAPIKYTDKQGAEKTAWRTVGKAWDNAGKIRIKFDTVPVGEGWDGTIMLFAEEEKQGGKANNDGIDW